MISSKMMLIPPQPLFFQMKLLSGKTFHGTRALNTLMSYVLRTWSRLYNSLRPLFISRIKDFNTSVRQRDQDTLLKLYSFFFSRSYTAVYRFHNSYVLQTHFARDNRIFVLNNTIGEIIHLKDLLVYSGKVHRS